MGVKHVFQLQVWGNTRLGQGGFYAYSEDEKSHADWISYNFHYHTALDKLVKGMSLYINSRYLDGFKMDQVGMSKRFPSNFSLDINIKGFTRPSSYRVNYLNNPDDWRTVWLSPIRYNASLNITASYLYSNIRAAGSVVVHLRTATLMSYPSYHYLEFTHINRLSIWRLDLRNRIYGRVGWGGYTPLESSLYLAGANPEDMMENKYTRSAAFFPQSWTTYTNDGNHFHYGGGINMRGYAGYSNTKGRSSAGESGWAINGELDCSRIVKVRKAKLNETIGVHPYLFADMGAIVSQNSTTKASELGQVIADAGVGVALSLKKFGPLQDIKPLTIRFDFPFYLSDPNSSNNWAMRWKLGINRAF
jgi:aminopeptidase N